MENLTETFYLSMILIGVGSFLFGILPIAFSFRGTRSYPFFLSLILCLGAGVLLATSLVHMLTEVQEKLKLNAQLYFCAGFFLLYTFDEISHYCLGSKKERQQRRNKNPRFGVAHASSHSLENSPLLDKTTQNKAFPTLPEVGHFDSRDSQQVFSARSQERDNEQPQQSPLDALYSTDSDQATQTVCHGEAGDLWADNSTAKTALLIALLVHSILEGISIGVQTKTSQILLILGAVTFHKIVLSFCLGVELRGSRPLHLVAAIFVFSIGSPIGIFLGMTVTSFEKGIFGIDAELQAVAAGSLLYVATFEVLPRERIKWQFNNRRRGARIFQLMFVLLGFTCITAFHVFLGSGDDGGGGGGGGGGGEIAANVTKKFH